MMSKIELTTGCVFGTQVGGDHYTRLHIQPAEYNHYNRLGWCEANVIKYVSRHQYKNGRQDIEKAIHFLEMLLEFEYTDKNETERNKTRDECG